MAYSRRRHDIEMVVTNFIAYIHMAVICLANFDRIGLLDLVAAYTVSRASTSRVAATVNLDGQDWVAARMLGHWRW